MTFFDGKQEDGCPISGAPERSQRTCIFQSRQMWEATALNSRPPLSRAPSFRLLPGERVGNLKPQSALFTRSAQ
jgi:hypothetical protein